MADYKVGVGVDIDFGELNKLKSEINSLTSKNHKVNINTSDVQKSMNNIAVGAKSSAKSVNSAFRNFNLNTYNKQLNSVNYGLNSIDRQSHVTKASLLETGEAYKSLSLAHMESVNSINKLGIGSKQASKALKEETKVAQEFTDSFTNTKNLVAIDRMADRQTKKIEKQANAVKKLDLNKQLFNSKIDNYIKNNSAVVGTEFESSLRDIQGRISSVTDASGLQRLSTEFQNVAVQAQLADKATMSLGDRIKNQITRYSTYFGVASAMMAGTQAIRSMYQNVLQVDTAMTELRRVTDIPESQYSNLFAEMTASAKEYGVALSDVISATADWSRAGFDANTAKGLAEVTTMYQHVSDLDYDEAAQNLLTSYKGFEKQLKETYGDDAVGAVGYIGDILNELDNNYAVTAAGVGEGLKRSAAALDVANNNIQQSAAMVAGTAEVTQDPEKAGNALKVVSMRLRGMKGELEELGEETDDNVENLSKMQGQVLNLTHGKVNIFDDKGDFKSTFEILQGIAGVWEDISDTDQAELLETIAGKHRANDIASLLQNWDNVEKMVVSATNATGSASAEQEKYMNSLQGHLDQLTASWQAFATTTMQSSSLNGVVDAGRGIVEIFTSLIDTIGVIPTVAGIAAAALSFKNTGIFTLKKDIDGVIPQLQIFKNSVSDLPDIFNNLFNKSSKKVSADLFGGKHSGFFSGISTELADSRSAVRKFNEAVSQGVKPSEAIETCFGGTSKHVRDATRELVNSGLKDGVLDRKSLDKQVYKNALTEAARDKSWGSKKSIIDNFANSYEKLGLSQMEYAEAVKKSDKYMGNYLSKQAQNAKIVNGAEAKMGGYVASLVGAKAATIGLQVATMALNTALTMGISLLISFAIEALMSWINHAEEVAEKANEIKSNFEEQKQTLKDTKSTIDEVSDPYERLSKGVDVNTNKNNSLSTDDYKEYLNIVNQIAEKFPSLAKGYDAQGNAILSCAGNVKELNEAYKQQEKEANDEFLKGAKTVAEDSKNKADELKKNTLSSTNTTKEAYDALKDLTKSSDLAKDIENMSMDTKNAVAKALLNSGFDRETYDETNDAFILRAMQNKNKSTVQSILNDYEQQMSHAASGMKQIAEATIGNALIDTYPNMSDNMQIMIKNMTAGMDYNFFDSDKINWDDNKLKNYINNTMSAINSLDDDKKKSIEVFFDVQSRMNDGDCTVGDYVSSISNVEKAISGLDGDAQYQIKMSMGIEDNEVKKKYDDFRKKLTDNHGLSKDVAKSIADGLTKAELDAAVELEVEGKLDFKNANPAAIKKQLEDRVKLNKAMNYTINIETETEGISKVNSALAEARSATGLTSESMDSLASRYKNLNTINYDAAKLFQETANGVSLNAEALNEYENAYNTEKLKETTDSLGALKDEYKNLNDQILEAQKSGDSKKVTDLLGKQEDIRQKISDLAELATMYEGLTSSYNEWQQAESAGNNRDMYQNMYSAQESIKKELDNGWIDDGTEKYFQLIWGKDKWDGAGKSIQDYRDQWSTLDDTIAGTSFSIKDFFKTNEDGELTSEGIFNFFDAVGQKQKELGKDWIQYDEDGNMKSFNFGVDGDKAIADAMGISEELVQIFLRASQDAGFVVNFDGTYTQLADMQNAANAAVSTLKDMGKTSFDFDFSTTNLESLNTQLEEAKRILGDSSFWNQDGSFNFDASGAKEAMQVASTLQATIDNLDNKYIGLTVEDDSFAEPLTKLQDYESKVAQLNQLKLNPQVNAEQIKTLEGDLQGIVDYFDKLPKEQKVELGIEGKTPEEIRSSIESGEITIPTTLDIQTHMSESLDDLRDLALLSSGLLSESQEAEIKAKFTIDDDEAKKEGEKAGEAAGEAAGDSANKSFQDKIKSIVDNGTEDALIKASKGDSSDGERLTRLDKFAKDDSNSYVNDYDENQQMRVIKFVGDWSEIDNYEPEQKKAVIEFVKDVADIDSYTPEQKEAIAKFVADVDDVNNYTPEQKEAIAKYVKDISDIDSYTPEQKQAVCNFIVNNQDVLAYTPEEKSGIAQYMVDPSAIDSFTPEQKEAVAKFIAEHGEVDSWNPNDRYAIASFLLDNIAVEGYQPSDKYPMVVFQKDSSQPDGWQPDPKTGTATYTASMTPWSPPTLSGIINYTAKIFGVGGVDGTAHVNGTAFANGTTGTAFAQGNWGTKENGVALGGELGTELLVRNGRWYTIGEDSAEFFGYKKGDIIK